MNSLIYIEITKEINFTYEKAFIKVIKEAVPGLETFDLDNYSDISLINYSLELIGQSEKCVVIINAEQNALLGKIMLVFETLIKHRENCFVIICGTDKYLQKISLQFQQKEYVEDLSDITAIVTGYLKSGSNPEGS